LYVKPVIVTVAFSWISKIQCTKKVSLASGGVHTLLIMLSLISCNCERNVYVKIVIIMEVKMLGPVVF
jgi:hypothetical protein